MKLLFALLLLCSIASADTPPARAINAQLYNGAGTDAITSTDINGKHGIDANIIQPPGDLSVSGSLTAACATGLSCGAGSTVSLSVNGISSAKLNVSGTWVGTIVVDLSTDNFSTFGTQTICGLAGTPSCSSAGTNANGYFTIVGVGSASQIRARMSAFTSGSATIVLTASLGNGTQAVISSNSANFNAQVVGNVASGAADSGNPIKDGGVYNSSLPSLISGNRGDLQVNKFSEASIAYRNDYHNIVGATSTTIKSGAGYLHSVCMNTTGNSETITIFDNTAASGTKIGTITPSQSGRCMDFDVEFSTGLTVSQTAAAADSTITYH